MFNRILIVSIGLCMLFSWTVLIQPSFADTQIDGITPTPSISPTDSPTPTGSVQALNISLPSFTSCTNPSGTIIASYDQGTHAIVGDPQVETGSDTVYQLSDISVTQCYCPDQLNSNQSGIQTNWYDVASLDDSTKQSLIQQGWISIANGSVWGLNNDPYLALNSNYTCHDTGLSTTITPTNTPAPTLTPTPTAGQPSTQTNDNSGSSNNSGSNNSGTVLAAATQINDPGTHGQVLGASTLANTGMFTDTMMRFILALGSSLVTLGGLLYGKKKIAHI